MPGKIDYQVLALPKIKPRPGAAAALPKTKDRAKRARGAKTIERSSKSEVRRLDRYCRFPKCGCGKKGYALAVAHLEHKGIGGNPAGDRSEIERMILLCAPRHREHKYSLDRSTIRIEPTTAAGTRGPCVWSVYVRRAFAGGAQHVGWIEIGREITPHFFEPFTSEQLAILKKLAEMKQ